MNFADRPPSSDWAALTHKGEAVAEAWFKPQGDPLALVFRVPQGRPHLAETVRRLTLDALLRTVAVPTEEVESWQLGDDDAPADADPRRPLPPAPPGETHLTVTVRLRPPAPPAAAANEPGEVAEIPPEKWQALDALWRAVLGLEATIEASRLSAESLRLELEGAFRKTLGVEEKVHALQADVAQWTKAKSRVHHVVPKIREFTHRATWALTLPERVRLANLVRDHFEPRIPFPDVERVREQLEHLQKDRQVLAAQGNAVHQEGRAILAEAQRTLNALQRNAADRARNKRSSAREKGKFF